MSGPLFVLPRQIPVNSVGRPYPLCTATFYRAGTTTLQNVYTTAALSVAHSNPLTSSSAGQFAAVYLDPASGYDYKVVIKDSAGATLYTEDNIVVGPTLTQAAIGAALYPRTADEITASVTPSDYSYPPGNILRYGAAGDGSDDAAEIQAAIDVAEAGLGFVYVPAGTYTVGATLNCNSGSVTVYGDGPLSVLKMATAANLNRLLYFTGDTATCHSLKLDGNRANQTTPTYGALCESSGVERTMFYGLTAVDSYTDGISIRTNGYGYISGCHIENCKLTGTKLTDVYYSRAVNNTYKDCQTSINVIVGGLDCVIANNTIIGDGGTICIDGIIVTPEYTAITASERVTVTGNTVYGCGDGSSGGGINIVCDSATRAEARVSVTGNVVTSCRDGILASNCKGISITGNVITNSDIRGIALSGVSDVAVIGNILNEHDNSASSPYAISVTTNADSGDSSGITILGNTIANTTQANTPVGIYAADSSQTGIIASGNIISGCTTAISIPAGAAPTIRSNVGYVTEAKGTATVASGATTAVVTHGLAYTPSAGEIVLTPAEQGSNDYGRVWVSTIGATQFTINVSADPGASNLDVGWSVRKV